MPKRLSTHGRQPGAGRGTDRALSRGAGETRGELEAELQVLEGDQTDYRVKRGLAHLLESAFSTFEMHSPLDPAELRQRVFALSAPSVPSPQQQSSHAHGGGGHTQP